MVLFCAGQHTGAGVIAKGVMLMGHQLTRYCIASLLGLPLMCGANDLTVPPANLADADVWSGTYRMEPGSKDNARPISTAIYTISKAPTLDAKNVAGRYESDLVRWTMRLQYSGKNDSSTLRRFVANKDLNEYEEFGWKEMHIAQKIECMDGGNFFFCKTAPNSTVRVGNEAFTTVSGIFGILLHAGVFELYKLPD
jgi:hypothetical protein